MLTINEALALLRSRMDEEDRARAAHDAAKSATAEAEIDVLALMREMGMDKAGSRVASPESGLTVTLRDKWKAKYDPERWGDIVDWMRSIGRDDLVQRRLNDSKIMDLVDNGVALPDGLAVESFTQLEVRRAR